MNHITFPLKIMYIIFFIKCEDFRDGSTNFALIYQDVLGNRSAINDPLSGHDDPYIVTWMYLM